MTQSADIPSQSVLVHPAVDISVVNGANLGDSLSFATELDPGDTYELRANAKRHRLSFIIREDGSFAIAKESRLGFPGAALHLDSCLTMMSGMGQTTEILVLVEVDDKGNVNNVYALPLSHLSERTGYALVGIDHENARQKFAQVACVFFSLGTHITMASGAQIPIERVNVDDLVLTRDDGPQAVRWIGQSTMRAVGEFAPIRIKAGTLHNESDLLVNPDQGDLTESKKWLQIM